MNDIIGMTPGQGDAIRAEQLGKTYAEGKLRTPVFDGLDLGVRTGAGRIEHDQIGA